LWRSRAMLYFGIIRYYIVTRGIMPLEIAIFNHNDYAIEVDGMSIRYIPNVCRRDDGSRLVF